jgi:hypothetical protein
MTWLIMDNLDIHTYMTSSSAHCVEAGEIFGKVMSDSDRLFCLDFLSLFKLQFK